MPVSYTLDNGAETHREFPDTFQIPAQEDREGLRLGDSDTRRRTLWRFGREHRQRELSFSHLAQILGWTE